MNRHTLLILSFSVCLLGCSTTYEASNLSGIETRSLTAQDLSEFGYLPDSGILIKHVAPNSSAFDKGLRSNQLITSVNGAAVTDSAEFSSKVLEAGYNANLTLETLNPNRETNTVVVATTQAEETRVEKKKFKFGVSIPFLLYRDEDEVSIIHLSAIRVPKAGSGKKGLMLLEMLGYMKKDNEWSARILFFTFGTGDWQP